ncbi:MAG: DUF3822 family protein [Bacteroidales bacterium]|nr:DUF3822 family protein [Bacteroidales bacterium]MCM1147931.1 DUF3822 family protein [Bacteroidales bacterium]MCM1205480.1 DUF3822 family protein [Bacillota bacterium]MCM1509258.1 DUF3822 family protein [Clostridium sp.]
MKQPRTIIRIGRQSLAFMSAGGTYEPYTVKSGMSMAANLREAFRESEVLSAAGDRVQVLADAPILLIPMEEYEESQAEPLYNHTFPQGNIVNGLNVNSGKVVISHVIPDLNCVAVFALNKDLRMVISDHFSDVRITPLLAPVWHHLHQRSYAGQTKKMFAYFHDRRLAVFCFGKNRFRFMNEFCATAVADSTYFILYVWQQLAMEHKKDELYIVGDILEPEALRDELRKYVHNVFPINPSAEFNRAPVTRIPNMPYDLMAYFMNFQVTEI